MITGNPERYLTLYKPQHPNSNSQGRIREHVYKASLALGKPIPKGIQVHHIDNVSKNNVNSNLLICTASYHKLIHARTDAYNLSGDANNMKCAYCGEYDSPSNMYKRPNQYQAWHLSCRQIKRKAGDAR